MSEANGTETKLFFLNPEQAMRCLAILYQARVPCHLIGGPGTAKTAIHEQFVARLNANNRNGSYGLWPIHLSSDELGDHMLPVPNHEKRIIEYYPTGTLPFNDPKARGVILLDDATKAKPELQPLMMNLMRERFFHGNTLGVGVFCSATSNAASDIFNSDVCEALQTRACNLYVSAGAEGYGEAWQAWAEGAGMLPETRAFRKFCSDGLVRHEQFEEWARFNDRTLEMADRVTQTCRSTQIKTDDIYSALVAGCVGRANGIKYEQMGRLVRDAPAPEEVAAHPDTAPIPVEPSVVYALICALVGHARKENAERMGDYALRLPKAHAFMLIQGVRKKKGCENITWNRKVQKWAEDNQALLT